MRIAARFKKGEQVRFVSHLDVQRMFQRSFRRAGMPVAYSQGFNPHPLTSFATALSVGCSSDAEWIDVKLDRDMSLTEFSMKLNSALPNGFFVCEAIEVGDNTPSLSVLMSAAEYRVLVNADTPENAADLKTVLDELICGAITVTKRGKGGEKEVDIAPQILKATVLSTCETSCILDVVGMLNASGGLNMELFMKALTDRWPHVKSYAVHRMNIFSDDGRILPKKPI